MEVGGDNVFGMVRIVLYTFLYHSNFEPYKCFMYSKKLNLKGWDKAILPWNANRNKLIWPHKRNWFKYSSRSKKKKAKAEKILVQLTLEYHGCEPAWVHHQHTDIFHWVVLQYYTVLGPLESTDAETQTQRLTMSYTWIWDREWCPKLPCCSRVNFP